MPKENLIDRLIDLVRKKKLLGFFLSTENRFLLGKSENFFQWTHNEYLLPTGRLYLGPKAYAQFGYDEEKHFSDDLKTTGVLASTWMGGISLGPARYLENKPTFLHLDIPGLWKITYRMASEREATQARSFLQKVIPEARFRISVHEKNTLLLILQTISLQEYWQWLRKTPLRLKQAVLGTLLCGLAVLGTSFTLFIHRKFEWICWICLVAFYAFFWDYLKQTYRWNNHRKAEIASSFESS